VRGVQEDLEDIEDAMHVSDWERVSYINRPFEIRKVQGMYCHTEHACYISVFYFTARVAVLLNM
jgi:autophagy-related protein 5